MSRLVPSVLSLALLLGAAGCSDGDGGDKDGSSSSLDAPGAPSADPGEEGAAQGGSPREFDLDAGVQLPEGVLRGNLAGDITNRFVTLHDDLAVITRPDGIEAVSLEDGESQWRHTVEGDPLWTDETNMGMVESGTPAAPYVDRETDTAYVALVVNIEGEGTTADQGRVEILAVDLESGDLAWRTQQPLDLSEATYPEHMTPTVQGVTNGAVVWSTTSGGVLTASVSAEDGTELWSGEAGGGPVRALAEGVVVVGGEEFHAAETITAYDVTTGERLWGMTSPEGKYEEYSAWPADADGNLLVVKSYEDKNYEDVWEQALLDVRSGEPTLDWRRTTTPPQSCRPPVEAALVCQQTQFDNDVLVLNPETLEALWSLPAPGRNPLAVSAMTDDLVYGSTDGQPVVVDLLTGDDVSTEIGVAPVMLNDQFGIGYADGVATAYPAS